MKSGIAVVASLCVVLGLLGHARPVVAQGTEGKQSIEEIRSQIEALEEKKNYYQKKINEITRKIRELEKKLTYGDFSIAFIERQESLTIKGEEAALAGPGIISIPKGADVFVAMLKVKNDGDKYIFIKKKMGLWGIMPGYLVDEEGDSYGEQGDAIRIGETAEPEGWVAKVKTKAEGWVKVAYSVTVTENVIAPGESYDWMFVFAVPTNRAVKEFVLRYGVAETTMDRAVRRKVTIPLRDKNKSRKEK